MDKKYAAILTANNICASYLMAETQNTPPQLMKFALTSGKIKPDNTPASAVTEFLFPTQVIEFSKDGTFSYIWMKGPTETGLIGGKWRVENSTLIFTFIDDKHPSVYAKNSELRYEIVKIANVAGTSLRFKGKSFAAITNIMTSSDSPIKDFEGIVSRIKKSALRN